MLRFYDNEEKTIYVRLLHQLFELRMSNQSQNNLLIDIQDSDFGETDVEDLHRNSAYDEKKKYNMKINKQSQENIELTNILNSFTNRSSPKINRDYDSQFNEGPPPIINILAENYRIKLTEKISNCNSYQKEQGLQFNQNQIIPILYLTPHIPQNKRRVHFIPDKFDTIPTNATVFDFNAAMIEHNERITERQELAIAYAEMLCNDISPSINSSSLISPCFKFSSQRSAAKIAFDRTAPPKNSRPTLPSKQNTKKKIKIYQMKDQNDKSNFSVCCKESFYNQQNYSYGPNSNLNDALSIFKVNVPSARTQPANNHCYQQQQQRKHNFKKNPSLSKPQCCSNSNGYNKYNYMGISQEKDSSSIRTKRFRRPLKVISQNNFDGNFSDSKYYENQNKSFNMFKDGLY